MKGDIEHFINVNLVGVDIPTDSEHSLDKNGPNLNCYRGSF